MTLSIFEQVLVLLVFFAVCGGLLFACDDLYLDLLAWYYSVAPHSLNDFDRHRMNAKEQKNIAIMIANWREEAVLERMIEGNIQQLNYHNYTFYLGVYPNDF